MPSRRGDKSAGFTLIEVLVALAIVSIALLAALRVAGQGTVNAADLRSRLLAGWVAENLLAEHQARGDWLPLGIENGTDHQGGIAFTWRQEVVATAHPAFRRVEVRVFAVGQDARALAHLTGFAANPPKVAK